MSSGPSAGIADSFGTGVVLPVLKKDCASVAEDIESSSVSAGEPVLDVFAVTVVLVGGGRTLILQCISWIYGIGNITD